MGEKIRDIGEFYLGKERYQIELNDGYDKAYSKYDIHIQNDRVQYCLSGSEFMTLASAFINAKEKLDALKSYKSTN